MKKFIFCILVMTLPFVGISQTHQFVDGIAAIVGDDVILYSEISGLVTQYAFQNKIDIARQPDLFEKLGNRFLQTMIDQKLLLIQADEDTIKADDDRVDQSLNQQLEYMINQAGSQETLEKYYSAPLFIIKRDLRKEITNQMRVGMLKEQRFKSIKISRKEVEKFYTQFSDSLPSRKASVDISHILLQVTPSEKSTQAALEKIRKIQEELKTGGDFAALAKKYSEDPGSAQNGGDLGYVTRGNFVKEFEEVAFALEKGQVSDIVQSQFGFHIIQMLDRQGERIHVRHILIRLQPSQADEEKVVEKLKKIRQKIVDGDSTFEEMALKYSNDPNVAKDKGELGEFEEGGFQIEAFATASAKLKEGEISEPFKTNFGYHIIRINRRTEARKYSLDKDWQQIEELALNHKREEEFQKWISNLRKEVPIIIKSNKI